MVTLDLSLAQWALEQLPQDDQLDAVFFVNDTPRSIMLRIGRTEYVVDPDMPVAVPARFAYVIEAERVPLTRVFKDPFEAEVEKAQAKPKRKTRKRKTKATSGTDSSSKD